MDNILWNKVNRLLSERIVNHHGFPTFIAFSKEEEMLPEVKICLKLLGETRYLSDKWNNPDLKVVTIEFQKYLSQKYENLSTDNLNKLANYFSYQWK